MWQQLLHQFKEGDMRALARCISFVENEQPGYDELLQQLVPGNAKVIGVTGPPGAGKSTLTDGLIGLLIQKGKRVCVMCVDPSSPFTRGSVLGDRIRMNGWHEKDQVYIRSLATRGSMGGLNPKIIEITELVKAGPFDYILIETAGVGQSEIEIAGLADVTVVVLVPEAGDEVQTMKAGLMEIADVFVVNKSDRPDADLFVQSLRQMLAPAFTTHKHEIPIIKTIASEKKGIDLLMAAVDKQYEHYLQSDKKIWLLAEKAYDLIRHRRMKDIDRHDLMQKIKDAATLPDFNLYRYIAANY